MQRVPETRHFESRPIPNPTHQRKTQLRYPKGNQENFLGIKIDIFWSKNLLFYTKITKKIFHCIEKCIFAPSVLYCFLKIPEKNCYTLEKLKKTFNFSK